MQVKTLTWIVLLSEQNGEPQDLTVHMAVPSSGVLETSESGKTKVSFIPAVNRSPRWVGMLLVELSIRVVSWPKPHFQMQGAALDKHPQVHAELGMAGWALGMVFSNPCLLFLQPPLPGNVPSVLEECGNESTIEHISDFTGLPPNKPNESTIEPISDFTGLSW